MTVNRRRFPPQWTFEEANHACFIDRALTSSALPRQTPCSRRCSALSKSGSTLKGIGAPNWPPSLFAYLLLGVRGAQRGAAFNSSGSLAMLAAIFLASSLVMRLVSGNDPSQSRPRTCAAHRCKGNGGLADYDVTYRELIDDGLHLLSFVGRDAVLATVSRNGKVEPTALYGQILEAAGDIRPKMIGIASSANVFSGAENDRSQVQQFVALLTRLAISANGSVQLISHPSLTGINSDSGLSGSTQWHNAVRARSYLKGIKPEFWRAAGR